MFWEQQYESKERVWGDSPSELAKIAVAEILKRYPSPVDLRILDLGCGYGRDSFYLASETGCTILGIDNSPKAVELANSLQVPQLKVTFRCCDFMDLEGAKFDIVIVSNVYQVLPLKLRKRLREKINEVLLSQGLVFLNNLSVIDPEEYGKGKPDTDEPNSFVGEKFLHFCTEEELRTDFEFLEIQELYEHAYVEPRSQGPDHNHISWVLIGKRYGGSVNDHT